MPIADAIHWQSLSSFILRLWLSTTLRMGALHTHQSHVNLESYFSSPKAAARSLGRRLASCDLHAASSIEYCWSALNWGNSVVANDGLFQTCTPPVYQSFGSDSWDSLSCKQKYTHICTQPRTAIATVACYLHCTLPIQILLLNRLMSVSTRISTLNCCVGGSLDSEFLNAEYSIF